MEPTDEYLTQLPLYSIAFKIPNYNSNIGNRWYKERITCEYHSRFNKWYVTCDENIIRNINIKNILDRDKYKIELTSLFTWYHNFFVSNHSKKFWTILLGDSDLCICKA